MLETQSSHITHKVERNGVVTLVKRFEDGHVVGEFLHRRGLEESEPWYVQEADDMIEVGEEDGKELSRIVIEFVLSAKDK